MEARLIGGVENGQGTAGVARFALCFGHRDDRERGQRTEALGRGNEVIASAGGEGEIGEGFESGVCFPIENSVPILGLG